MDCICYRLEQNQKKWQTDFESLQGPEDSEMYLSVKNGKREYMLCSDNSEPTGAVTINYCPFCGRKLN